MSNDQRTHGLLNPMAGVVLRVPTDASDRADALAVALLLLLALLTLVKGPRDAGKSWGRRAQSDLHDTAQAEGGAVCCVL